MAKFLSKLPKITASSAKRKGRGAASGSGAKSGRGTTRHQAARESIPLHFEGGQGKMTKRYPLLRGKGKNKSKQSPQRAICIEVLNTYNNGEEVTIETLMKKSVLESGKTIHRVKIISGGNLEKKLTLRVPATTSVKKQVEKLGGIVEVS